MSGSGPETRAAETRAATLPRILAVGMLDVAVFGSDTFFVEVGEEEVALYRAHRDGRVGLEVPGTAPLAYVTSSIEKFNSTYRLVPPLPIASVADLPRYLGRFEIASDTSCRLARRD